MKKKVISFLLIFICLITSFSPVIKLEAKRVWVSGYTRKDGTRVKGHYRNINSTSSSNASRSINKVNATNTTTKIITNTTINNQQYNNQQ